MEYMIIKIFLFIGVPLIITSINNNINSLKSDLERMNSTLYKIAEQIGIPKPPIDDELKVLIEEGKKIEAIKKVRMDLGLSLKDAKEYVDSL